MSRLLTDDDMMQMGEIERAPRSTSNKLSVAASYAGGPDRSQRTIFEFIAEAFKAGARGYVSKEQLDDTVLAAIRRVFAGGIYLSETLQAQFATQFLGRHTPNASSPIAALSAYIVSADFLIALVVRWVTKG